MGGRLHDSASPYLRSHSDNPVDWWPWGEEAFAEAERRDVPVLISIGYATCHWCHVMARESFSDPALAADLNARFVAIKVDREEHPDVDATYLAAASAFTPHLGWPLTVFTTPGGTAFYAGTYYPPTPVGQQPSFRQVLDAITEAWTERRDEVEAAAVAVLEAISAARPEPSGLLPDPSALDDAVARLESLEDTEFGGFGGAPKFPQAPVLAFLLAHGSPRARALARRTLDAMAASPLRDGVEGGFFRYSVQRDWSEPHYERMLSDNAQLLRSYSALGDDGAEVAAGIADFLLDVLRLPNGAFASAQDSESDLDGIRSEGGYYALDAAARARHPPPALDGKVLTGLNGLAIGALAEAGVRFARADWIAAARTAADAVLELHGADPPIARASLDALISSAVATLEDYGGLAGGLLRLALASGEPSYAVRARGLVEACATSAGIAAPGGADPVLAARGIALPVDPSDGAVPSGLAALADAALLLWSLTGEDRHRRIAETAIAPALDGATERAPAFGAALEIAARLGGELHQLVVVTPGGIGADAGVPTVETARAWSRPGGVLAIVTPEQASRFAAAGFELFASRSTVGGQPTAYLCRHFVCELPITSAADLSVKLSA